jgi:predicted transposase YdaD
LGNGASAHIFLREHLPPRIAALLGPEPPEPDCASFVDEDLAQHHSDLLFRLSLNTGSDTLAYVLFEHKSAPDPATPLQLLRYIVRVLAKWYDEHKRLPLPVVLPLIVHQGPKGWECSTSFIDLFGPVPSALRPYLPSFRHALVDLARIADQKLSTDVRLSARLRAMKYVQRGDLARRLRSIFAPGLSDVDIQPILHYIDNSSVAVSPEALQAALRERLGQQRGEQIMGFTQEFEARGRAAGLAQGRAEGLAEGEARGEARGEFKGEVNGRAKTLLRLLEKRFGAATVTAEIRERVFAADLPTLEVWLDRIIEADKPARVFAP